MIRWFYIQLLWLHPPEFRVRFGDEMLGIFDEHPRSGRGALVADAVVSLLRQRLLRPREGAPAVYASMAQPSDVPLFLPCDTRLPRRSTLAQGMLLSVAAFALLSFGISRGGGVARRIVIAAHRAGAGVLGVARSSVAEVGATTEVEVKPPARDPLFDLADRYFGLILVLDAIDRDRDRNLSVQEIASAAETLAGLDRDHDGVLSAKECGFSLGRDPRQKVAPEIASKAVIQFMIRNPVLAALDRDHDLTISQREMEDSPNALRRLDRDGDRSLAPIEILPAGAVRNWR